MSKKTNKADSKKANDANKEPNEPKDYGHALNTYFKKQGITSVKEKDEFAKQKE